MDRIIYIADDDENVRMLIEAFLLKDGYKVEVFENGDLLYDAFTAKPCDLVVLDIMMPGSSGFTVCTKLRKVSSVPIIMLTARATDEDYISGLSLGSDDYLIKPFSPAKLVMRINAMFRRIELETNARNADNKNNSKASIYFGDITFNSDNLTVYCKDTELSLTSKEFNLMEYLLKNSERAISRDELLTEVWGYESIVETRVTDDTVKRIRRKLTAACSSVSIDTVWGHGFRIVVKGDLK